MDYASCALIVEKALKEIPELTSVNVNYATEKAVVESDMAIDGGKIIAAVKDKTSYELVEEIKQGSLRGGHVMPDGQQMSGGMEGMGEHDHAKMLKEEEIRSLRKNFILGQHYLLLSYY